MTLYRKKSVKYEAWFWTGKNRDEWPPWVPKAHMKTQGGVWFVRVEGRFQLEDIMTDAAFRETYEAVA
jgi:hypothetical protein